MHARVCTMVRCRGREHGKDKNTCAFIHGYTPRFSTTLVARWVEAGVHMSRKRSSRRTRRRKQQTTPTCNDNAAPSVVSPHRAVGRLGHCKDVRFTLVESRAVVPVPERERVVDAHQPVGCAVSAVWCVWTRGHVGTDYITSGTCGGLR